MAWSNETSARSNSATAFQYSRRADLELMAEIQSALLLPQVLSDLVQPDQLAGEGCFPGVVCHFVSSEDSELNSAQSLSARE